MKKFIMKEVLFIKKIKFYNKKEIKEILESKEKLVYVDDSINEAVIKYKDIADFIVDYNNKVGQTDLKFYEYGAETLTPIITTFGSFLNHCNIEVKKDIIDRLNHLQQGGKISNYKVIDEDNLETVLNELDLDNNIKI